MAYRYVDPSTGSNSDNGTTFDLAWATLEYAAESGGLVAGDIVWVRRNQSEIPTTDIVPTTVGSFASPVYFIGCPRATHSITSSDWENGNNVVNIDDNNMVRERHCGRYITAPNGGKYLITRVISSSSVNIDREYAGTTVTNQTATIHADEDYDLFQAIDDSTWTIKKTDWNADAHNLYQINFNSQAYKVETPTSVQFWKNFEFLNSADTSGCFGNYSGMNNLVGCLISATTNNNLVGSSTLKRCIISGNNTGSNQRANAYGNIIFTDGAIYGLGSRCFDSTYNVMLNNVNIGVEVANSSAELRPAQAINWALFDVRLGGTNGYISTAINEPNWRIRIENYQKILGSHRTFFSGGYFENFAVTSGTTPALKVADEVVRIYPNLNYHAVNNLDLAYKIFEHRVWADTTSRSYRYWIYNNLSAVINDLTATDNLFLKVAYLSAYDDTSEYQYTTVYSTQIDIAQAADASDWDYLEVTGIQPAVVGWVILEVFQSQYSASGYICIDPSVVIS